MRVRGFVLPILGMPTFVSGAALLGGGPSDVLLAGVAMLVGALALALGMAEW